jgi:chromosome segregation ATPase
LISQELEAVRQANFEAE